jgi:hypothetical protein
VSPSATTVPIHEISLPQAHGIPSGKRQPLSVVSGDAVPTGALLNDALLENRPLKNSSKSVVVLLAPLLHIVVLGGPILAGLYHTETINLKEFTATILVAPSPPPPAPPPAAAAIKSRAPKRVFMSEGNPIICDICSFAVTVCLRYR